MQVDTVMRIDSLIGELKQHGGGVTLAICISG